MNEAPSRLRARTEVIGNSQSRPDFRDLRTRSRRPLTRLAWDASCRWSSFATELHSVSDRTAAEARSALNGDALNWRKALALAGPAVIVSIAYVDPGNIAANIQAGARYGYDLLWVVLAANLIAMLFQGLSAKLGIVTGKNLAELSREHFPRRVVLAMWMASEIAAIATDLAEFTGGAVGFALLLNVSLFTGMVITGIAACAIVTLQSAEFRPIEIVIGVFVGVIAMSYIAELFIAPPRWSAVGLHAVLPTLHSSGELTLAVAMVGATVMPHTLYLHSGLTQNRVSPRSRPERRRLISFSNREVICALTIAGLVNLAMVVMAAASFHGLPGSWNIGIETAYRTLIPLFGAGAAAIFMISLIASGVSSSVVGVMASQVIMQGFVGFRIPVWVRRLLTMIPAFVLAACNVSVTTTLVLSQVVLSMVLPLPMITLLIFTGREDIAGSFANRHGVQLIAIGAAVLVILLNLFLLLQTAGIDPLSMLYSA